LTKRLEAIYSGLNLRSNQEGKVDLDLSLLKMRSIVIGVVGQANVPGNYTLNGATSPVNALFAAGGINRLGSYRNITIVRNNKTIAEIDLYHFLVNGISPNISLRDQDVILVPYATKQVYIEEGFKKTGVFELKNEETLSESPSIQWWLFSQCQ
jgi:polysaccharide export outer membrane protein